MFILYYDKLATLSIRLISDICFFKSMHAKRIVQSVSKKQPPVNGAVWSKRIFSEYKGIVQSVSKNSLQLMVQSGAKGSSVSIKGLYCLCS